MEVIFRISGKVLISCIRGDVDHHSALPLRQAIDKSMKAFDCSDLVMDFSGVDFMDSSGIAVVMGTMRCAKEYSAGMRLIGVGQQPGKVLRAAGIERLMPLGQEMYI